MGASFPFLAALQWLGLVSEEEIIQASGQRCSKPCF